MLTPCNMVEDVSMEQIWCALSQYRFIVYMNTWIIIITLVATYVYA